MRGLSSILLSLILSPEVIRGYCVLPGHNPTFNGPPKVEQLSLTRVRLSWSDGIMAYRECTDQFLVKYGIKSEFSTKYELSDQIPANNNYIDLNVTPRQTYIFELVAREDKGMVGIDWNKAPKVEFRTAKTFIPASDPPPPSSQAESDSIVPQTVTEEDLSPVTFVEDSPEDEYHIGGLSVEAFAGLVVAGIIGLIILAGTAYKAVITVAAAKRSRSKSGSTDEEAAQELNPEARTA